MLDYLIFVHGKHKFVYYIGDILLNRSHLIHCGLEDGNNWKKRYSRFIYKLVYPTNQVPKIQLGSGSLFPWEFRSKRNT